MNWVVFTYSLPSKNTSSSRVTLWRRLRRIGAISPKSGVFVLPDTEESLESFQWLAQEVQQAKGEALVMRVEKFESLSDDQIIEFFHQALKEDYEEILSQAEALEKAVKRKIKPEEQHEYTVTLEKLRKRFADLHRIDFFNSSDATPITSKIDRVTLLLNASLGTEALIPRAKLKEFQNKCWVTRPKPHVDRLGCIWLIRRFIDSKAEIHYATTAEPDEVPFDMKGVRFGHQGSLCSFETMMKAFHLTDPGLQPIAEIIHELDLRDGLYLRPETEGVAAILKGWQLANFSNNELETNGIQLFEGLYATFTKRGGP